MGHQSRISRQQKRASQRAMTKHTEQMAKAGLKPYLVQRIKDFIANKMKPMAE